MTLLAPLEADSAALKEARLERVRAQTVQWFASLFNFSAPFPMSVSVAARGDYDEVLVFLPADYVDRAEAKTHDLETALYAGGTPAYVYVWSGEQVVGQ